MLVRAGLTGSETVDRGSHLGVSRWNNRQLDSCNPGDRLGGLAAIFISNG